ncbi:fascin domain-containing protein, partial [Candidatus Burkholderia verschuerenii]|uniref:fascin domain-containing protein n=1 Tax=Candidatus Burkholderia verschuerenii TaxID=242163 RepID=UPI000AF996B2
MNSEPVKIALKGSDGLFVTVVDGTDLLTSTSTVCGNNEVFEMIYQQVMVFALLAANGKYVSILNDTNFLAAISGAVGSTETFEMFNWHEDDRIVLFASNQSYIQLAKPSSTLQA